MLIQVSNIVLDYRTRSVRMMPGILFLYQLFSTVLFTSVLGIVLSLEDLAVNQTDIICILGSFILYLCSVSIWLVCYMI
jgi:hypothetical protein